MIYKILFIIVTLLTIYQHSNIFKKTDLEPLKKLIRENGVGVMTTVVVIVSFMMSLPYVIFYIMSYNISPFMQWFSAVQIVVALFNFFSAFTIATKVENGTFEKNVFRSLLIVGMDIVYLFIVAIAIF